MSNGNNKVYLAGLPPDSNEDTVKEMVENASAVASPSSIASIKVLKKSSDVCYAFIELTNPDEVTTVIEKLNGKSCAATSSTSGPKKSLKLLHSWHFFQDFPSKAARFMRNFLKTSEGKSFKAYSFGY